MMWYEEKDQYNIEDPLGERAWPLSLSLVHVYKTKQGGVATTSGWGKKDFMENYLQGKFRPKAYLHRYQFGRAFGIIIRALPLVCVDIDGKNGGLETARVLHLPPTLAETSKSGNGFHLFYRTPGDTWSEEFGFDQVADYTGIIPGVDIKGEGIVYHYPGQRWNNLPIAPASQGLMRLIEARRENRERSRQVSQQLRSMDPEDRAIAADKLEERLARPFPEGTRNTGLYAWGMKAKGIVPQWEAKLAYRGQQLELEMSEILTIIDNVEKYGSGE